MKRPLSFYTPASTANPTGWRPWRSRLSFYSPGAFSLPTTGTRIPSQRSANGGLGSVQFPNYAGLARSRAWRTRDNASSPTPWIYKTERHGMSGLGVVPIIAQTGWAPPSGVSPTMFWGAQPPTITSTPQTGTGATPTYRRLTPPPQGSFVTSSPETGSIVSYQPNTGTPIYPYGANVPASSSASAVSSVAPSTVVIGYDANGNPVYQGQTLSAAGLPISSTTPPSSTASWFSQDSLGLGLNNGIYAIAAVGLVLIFKKK